MSANATRTAVNRILISLEQSTLTDAESLGIDDITSTDIYSFVSRVLNLRGAQEATFTRLSKLANLEGINSGAKEQISNIFVGEVLE